MSESVVARQLRIRARLNIGDWEYVCGRLNTAAEAERLTSALEQAQRERDEAFKASWPVALDGEHDPYGARLWLARQLMDSKLSAREVFSIVAYHDDITSRHKDRALVAERERDALKGALKQIAQLASLGSVANRRVRITAIARQALKEAGDAG